MHRAVTKHSRKRVPVNRRYFCLWTRTAPLALLSVVVSGASADEPRPFPPVRAIPAARPEFRAVVPDAEYADRRDRALARLGDWSHWKETQRPAIGQLVTGVFPDSTAARLNVQAGDLVTRRDGKLVWGDTLPRSDESRDVEYYSASDDRLHTVRLGNEMFGVNLRRYWRPEFLYLRGPQRDPRWDQDVMAAIAARGTDPDLAESALRSAVDLGYQPDTVSDQVGAEIALCQNRYDVAAAFGWFAERAWRNGDETVCPMVLLRIALACGHLDVGGEFVQSAPDQFEYLHHAALPYLLELHRRRAGDHITAVPPSVLANEMYHDDLRRRLRGSTFMGIRDIPKIHAGEPFELAAGTAHYHTLDFELPGPVPNFDFTVRLTVQPTVQTLDDYTKFVSVGVEKMNPGDGVPYNRRANALGVGITEFGDVELKIAEAAYGLYFTDPTVDRPVDHVNTIRIVRVGQAAEVFLNGHRLYYGPVKDEAPVVRFSLHVVGATATVHSVDVVELMERAPAE